MSRELPAGWSLDNDWWLWRAARPGDEALVHDTSHGFMGGRTGKSRVYTRSIGLAKMIDAGTSIDDYSRDIDAALMDGHGADLYHQRDSQ